VVWWDVRCVGRDPRDTDLVELLIAMPAKDPHVAAALSEAEAEAEAEALREKLRDF
jgi:hypothetical protein